MIHSQREMVAFRHALSKVLESVTFHKATRLKQLLSHLCEQELAGHGADLKEHEIGVHVFGRGENFETAEDSIVRASMRQLRSKLLEYYASQGAEDEWQIEIPKGHYVPVLVASAVSTKLPEARELDSADGREPIGKRKTRWMWMALASSVSALMLAAFFFGLWVSSPGSGERAVDAATGPATGSVMEHFLTSTQGPVRLVPSDSVVNIVRSYSGRPLTLENYRSKQFFDESGPAARANPEHWRTMVSRELMNIGDASIALRTAREYPGHAKRLTFRQARDLRARDLKEGNYIFLGSVSANPWLQLFDDLLNFRLEAPGAEDSPRWRNRTPRAGESEWFPPAAPKPADNRITSYAHVAIVPNRSHSGDVLIVAGLTMPDTEAAGEFVLSEDSGEIISSALGKRSLEETPYFEVLLETHRTGNVWSVSSAIASRAIRGEPEVSAVKLP